jgi:acyl dehydratase
MSVELLSNPPSVGAVLSRAAISPLLKRDRKPVLPDFTFGINGVRTDRAKLAAYNAVCGFPANAVPATWLHILAFPLHGALLTHDKFPFPMIGLVHITNVIRQQRPVGVDEAVDIRARLGNLRAHDKGVLFSVLTEITVKGQKVWEEESVYLRMGKFKNLSAPKAENPSDDVPVEYNIDTTQVWELPEDLGRRYGSASGDMNPIHLYPITAKAFGFKRAIAHGMWTHAHALAKLSSFVGSNPFTLSTHFKLPVFLPAKITFRNKQDGNAFLFEVRDREGSKPHARGRITLG